ncbi:MAG: transcriptional repressor [Acidobacteriota bacterium]
MPFRAEHQALNEFLDKRSMKRSRKRQLVLECFLRSESHLSAEDLYRLVHREHPEIGRSTVYRALKLFCESGVARQVDLRDGRERYEHHFQHPHHDHMVCTTCGRTFEFVCQEIEALQGRVAESIKFAAASHTLQIFGECAACRRRARRRRLTAPPTSHRLIELDRNTTRQKAVTAGSDPAVRGTRHR